MKSGFRLLLLAVALVSPRFAFSEEAAIFSKCACEETLVVDTREAPLCGDLAGGFSQIRYLKRDLSGGLKSVDSDHIFAPEFAGVPTMMLVHGNRTDAAGALQDADYLRDVMQTNCRVAGFRLIVWSWPSEKVTRHQREDAQLKVFRSDAQSYYVARFLQSDSVEKMRKTSPFAVVGYSLGTRVVSGALQLSSGAELDGRTLPALKKDKPDGGDEYNPELNVVFVAGAVDAESLASDGRYGKALSQVKSLLVTRNGSDRVLKWYPFLWRRDGPEALGYVGPCGLSDPDRVNVLDVECHVGKTHKWERYLNSPSLLAALKENLVSRRSTTKLPPKVAAQ